MAGNLSQSSPAVDRPELASVSSDIAGSEINRFLHVPTKPGDLVTKHEMQRELGRRTGTCFQRCVGLDAIGACHSVTFDMDAECGTDYHARFLAFLRRAQLANIVVGGAMTDPKGDRSRSPHQQTDPDLFLRVVRRDNPGIWVSGSQDAPDRCGQLALAPPHADRCAPPPPDREWSVVGAVRVDAPGLTYIVGRQTNDTRAVDGGDLDAGNARFAGQEALIMFENVFVPHEHVFHGRRVEVCTSTWSSGSPPITARPTSVKQVGRRADRGRASAAEYNGVEAASHVRTNWSR